MDRLVAETEKKEKIVENSTKNVQNIQKIAENSTKIAENSQKFDKNEQKSLQNQQTYLNSFENLTVADIKREQEKKQQEEFKKEKEILLKEQFEEPKAQEAQEAQEAAKPQNIIEKPNYDLIEENPKIVKIKTKQKSKKAFSKKTAAIVLSCVLSITTIIAVSNAIVIDQMESSFSQIETTYNLKLRDYLQRITELDGTKMGSEIIETYPDETKNAGDLGTKSNWFDRLCNFIARLFGG